MRVFVQVYYLGLIKKISMEARVADYDNSMYKTIEVDGGYE